jgi:hypothetical protein
MKTKTKVKTAGHQEAERPLEKKEPAFTLSPEQMAAVRALPPRKLEIAPAPVKSPAQSGAEDAERLLARGSGSWRKG